MKKASPSSSSASQAGAGSIDGTRACSSSMAIGGLRLTPQRRHVHDVLMEKLDHPTATEVFLRVQKRMPSISLATVYNCLETMVGNGLVKAVHMDREPTRFCANLHDHGHFHCTECGLVSDVEYAGLPDSLESHHVPAAGGWILPRGFVVTQQDISLRGLCSSCSEVAGVLSDTSHSSQ